MDDNAIRKLLQTATVIGVVGADRHPDGTAEMAFLRDWDYRVPEVGLDLAEPSEPLEILYVMDATGVCLEGLKRLTQKGLSCIWLRQEQLAANLTELAAQDGLGLVVGRSIQREYIAHFLSSCSA